MNETLAQLITEGGTFVSLAVVFVLVAGILWFFNDREKVMDRMKEYVDENFVRYVEYREFRDGIKGDILEIKKGVEHIRRTITE